MVSLYTGFKICHLINTLLCIHFKKKKKKENLNNNIPAIPNIFISETNFELYKNAAVLIKLKNILLMHKL